MSNDRECKANASLAIVPAPELNYRPPMPSGPVPGIGLVGCGGIAPYHLRAYRAAEWPVLVLHDRHRERAEALRDEHFPDALVVNSIEELLALEDVGVVDLTPHPRDRLSLIEASLNAGKHVLSQKPFAQDLDTGRRLIALARSRGLHLAVNQNGRWAPHFSWMRKAVAAGLIGDVMAVHCAVHWDHNWTAGTSFDAVRHLILADFGIHWFDMLGQLLPGKHPLSVFASAVRSKSQRSAPPLLAQVAVQYESARATLVFDADSRFGALDETVVIGERGTLRSSGPDLCNQAVTLTTEAGVATPALEGDWFTSGFAGTMGELLCAIEEGREPANAAHTVMPGLALCFAAVTSADTGEAVRVAKPTA